MAVQRRSAAAIVQSRKQVAAGSMAAAPGGPSSQQLDPTVWYDRLHKEKPNLLCKQSYQTCGSAATAAETSKAEEVATRKAAKKKKQRAAKRAAAKIAAKEAANNAAAIAEPADRTRGRANSKEKTKKQRAAKRAAAKIAAKEADNNAAATAEPEDRIGGRPNSQEKSKKQSAAKIAAKEADNDIAVVADPAERTRGRPNSKEKTKTGCHTAAISRSRCNSLLESDLNLLHTTLVAESVSKDFSQRALNVPQDRSISVADSTSRVSVTTLKQSEYERPNGESEELGDDEEWDEDEGDDARETDLGEARLRSEGDGLEEDQSSTEGDREDQRASAVQSRVELLGTDDDEGSTDLSALLASSDDDSPQIPSLPLEQDLERVSAEVSPASYVCLSPASRTQNEKTPPQKRGTKWRGALNQIYTDYEYGETDSLLDRAKYDTTSVKKGCKSIRSMYDARMEE